MELQNLRCSGSAQVGKLKCEATLQSCLRLSLKTERPATLPVTPNGQKAAPGSWAPGQPCPCNPSFLLPQTGCPGALGDGNSPATPQPCLCPVETAAAQAQGLCPPGALASPEHWGLGLSLGWGRVYLSPYPASHTRLPSVVCRGLGGLARAPCDTGQKAPGTLGGSVT